MAQQHHKMPPQTQQECFDMMLKISELIKDGAIEFFCLAFSLLIYFAVDFPPYTGRTRYILFMPSQTLDL